MALEDWKDFVGNTATFFTILQFLIGSQVVLTLSRLISKSSSQVCYGFYKKKTTGET